MNDLITHHWDWQYGEERWHRFTKCMTGDAYAKLKKRGWRHKGYLTLKGATKTRSGYVYHWMSPIGIQLVYEMMHTELLDIMMREGIGPDGIIHGCFELIKRGNRVGIKIVREEE